MYRSFAGRYKQARKAVVSMVLGFQEATLHADRNARERDIKNQIDLDAMSNEFKKAADRGLKIVQHKDKNRAQFAQLIAPNMRHLFKTKYLTTAESAFLIAIAGYVEMHSNAVVSYERDEQGQYLKIAGLAELLNYSESQTSRLVNALINKGIIYELVDTLTIKKYGRVIQERPLFLNPEIVFCGDRNRINATLCRLIINADHMERGKDKIRLPWKLWLDRGCEFGRLYRRDTWLKKKKKS